MVKTGDKHTQYSIDIYAKIKNCFLQLIPTAVPINKIKLKFFGHSGVGKSTLIESLKVFTNTNTNTNTNANANANANANTNTNTNTNTNRYNNMAHPDWGSVDNRLTRKTPASYR